MQDAGRLTKIPGIGKKTAERLVLELRDKLPKAVTSVRGESATGASSDVVNALLSKGQTTIKQTEVVRLIEASGVKRTTIFEDHYLDFEDAYRSRGWTVEYDKPGYNESGEPVWRFSR